VKRQRPPNCPPRGFLHLVSKIAGDCQNKPAGAGTVDRLARATTASSGCIGALLADEAEGLLHFLVPYRPLDQGQGCADMDDRQVLGAAG
jgi:hypothetical protein